MRASATIGFRETIEKMDENGNPTSIWVEKITRRTYKAEVINNTYRNQQGESINDNYVINVKLSMIACDAYTISHLDSIIYCEWEHKKWKVNSVDLQRPRIVVTLGGDYNETENGSRSCI